MLKIGINTFSEIYSSDIKRSKGRDERKKKTEEWRGLQSNREHIQK